MTRRIKDNQLIILCDKWYMEHNNLVKRFELAKPAYRVYADKDGDLFVAERTARGGICQTFTDDITWISDWVEYDPSN